MPDVPKPFNSKKPPSDEWFIEHAPTADADEELSPAQNWAINGPRWLRQLLAAKSEQAHFKYSADRRLVACQDDATSFETRLRAALENRLVSVEARSALERLLQHPDQVSTNPGDAEVAKAFLELEDAQHELQSQQKASQQEVKSLEAGTRQIEGRARNLRKELEETELRTAAAMDSFEKDIVAAEQGEALLNDDLQELDALKAEAHLLVAFAEQEHGAKRALALHHVFEEVLGVTCYEAKLRDAEQRLQDDRKRHRRELVRLSAHHQSEVDALHTKHEEEMRGAYGQMQALQAELEQSINHRHELIGDLEQAHAQTELAQRRGCPVTHMGWPTPIVTSLIRAGHLTAGQVASLSVTELHAIHGLGPERVAEIIDSLNHWGL